jgi:hypothetical protein
VTADPTLRLSVGRGDAAPEPPSEMETWLRGLSWVLGPAAPGVAASSMGAVDVSAKSGEILEVRLEVVNRQAAASLVRVAMSPLAGPDEIRWDPPASTSIWLHPHQAAITRLVVSVPPDLPPGRYEGSLTLLGVEAGRVPLAVEVSS